ncbi:MAG TPA: ABC transporter substrate-binding protein [Victivallales bacterium]|nr:ABC transporter substrate-binding protein [Victivallales bacterium]
MKKFIVRYKYLLITAIFGVSLLSLSGCEKKTYPVGTPQNPYKIVWYQFGTPQKDLKMVEKKANEYLRKKIGAVLDITMIDPGEYNKKLNIIEISGGKFDLCFTAAWTNNYVRNAARGAFYPLNKLLDKYGQGIKKSVNPYFLNGAKIDGELYAIPTNKEIGLQIRYLFNDNFLSKSGFSLKSFKPLAGVDTLKSLMPYFAYIKKNHPGIIPFGIDNHSSFITNKYTFLNGNSFFPGAVKLEKGNYKVVDQLDSKTYKEYYKVLHEMYQKEYIQGGAPQLANSQSLMLTGKTAVETGQYQPCADNLWSSEYGYKVVSLPKFKPVITNVMVEGAMIAISINAKRPDIDMKFLNLLNTDKYLRNLLQYGIKGVHYKKIGPNRIKYLPAHKSYIMYSFTLGNLFNTYLLPKDASDKWEQFEKFNASATPSQILGFHFDPTPVSSQFAAMTNVVQQYQSGLFTGQMDYKTYLPKFIKALKDAGMKKLLAEEQKQLNEWVKKHKKPEHKADSLKAKK